MTTPGLGAVEALAAPHKTGVHKRDPRLRAERPLARSSRAPPAVDDVGDAATELALKVSNAKIPRLVASSAQVRAAPIGAKEAFVLSLVDGRLCLAGLVDASGLARRDVQRILARLLDLDLVRLQ